MVHITKGYVIDLNILFQLRSGKAVEEVTWIDYGKSQEDKLWVLIYMRIQTLMMV